MTHDTKAYLPMPVKAHLARGHCCEAEPQCKLCPYHGARQAPKKPATRIAGKVDPLLTDYIKRAANGEKLDYYSDSLSLVPVITIAENLTIHYQLAQQDSLTIPLRLVAGGMRVI